MYSKSIEQRTGFDSTTLYVIKVDCGGFRWHNIEYFICVAHKLLPENAWYFINHGTLDIGGWDKDKMTQLYDVIRTMMNASENDKVVVFKETNELNPRVYGGTDIVDILYDSLITFTNWVSKLQRIEGGKNKLSQLVHYLVNMFGYNNTQEGAWHQMQGAHWIYQSQIEGMMPEKNPVNSDYRVKLIELFGELYEFNEKAREDITEVT